MRLLSTRLLAGLATLAVPAAAQVPVGTYEIASPGQADANATGGQAHELAVRKDGYDRMTVPVRVAGAGPYRFLIDTGADRTAISRDLARRLNIAAGGGATLHSVTGVSPVGTATVSELDLKAKRMRNVEAALLEARHMGADGILGLDSLTSQRILFDFKAQTLTVHPAAGAPADEPGTIVVQGRRKKGRLVITEAQADATRVTVVVDTGAQVTIGNEALRKRLAAQGLLRASGTVELMSVTGETLKGEYMFVKRLNLGPVELANLAIVFTDAHTFRQMKLDRKPALLLGMNALRAFERVSIDFAARKLRVVPPEKSALEGAAFAAR